MAAIRRGRLLAGDRGAVAELSARRHPHHPPERRVASHGAAFVGTLVGAGLALMIIYATEPPGAWKGFVTARVAIAYSPATVVLSSITVWLGLRVRDVRLMRLARQARTSAGTHAAAANVSASASEPPRRTASQRISLAPTVHATDPDARSPAPAHPQSTR